MQFIEMTGETLLQVINEGEIDLAALRAAGLTPASLVRVNRQGDIELRKQEGWDVVGGLLGEFDHRLHVATGLDWA